MTKRLALFAVALGAAASFAAPASAEGPSCPIDAVKECVDQILTGLPYIDRPAPICLKPQVCIGASAR